MLLVRGGSLSGAARTAAVVAAIGSALAVPGMLVHLVAAVETPALTTGAPTPLVHTHVVAETVTVPLFGLGIAVLAAVGAATRTVGNRVTAIPGVVGGIAYALAGGTFAFSELFEPLFPFASLIAVWAVAAGAGLLLRRRAA